MDFKNYVIQQFDQHLENEGYFWRLANKNTFIDLLLFQTGKVSTKGLDRETALEVLYICIKALVNDKMGLIKYKPDYKKLNKELFTERSIIRTEIEEILTNVYLKQQLPNGEITEFTSEDFLLLFNQIAKEEHTTDIFERILMNVIKYLDQ